MQRVKTKILVILLSLCFTFSAFAEGVNAKFLYKVNLNGNNAPGDVLPEKDGSVHIYDAFTGSYITYSSDGEAITAVAKPFLKGGNCLVKHENYFLYCNSSEGSIDMLTKEMEKFASYRLPEGTKGHFDPTDAYVSGGSLFAVDNDNHRVVKISLTTGDLEQTIGGYGQAKLSFWYPYSIAVDSRGVLYITEVMNTRVQKITKELKFYEFIGQWGIKRGEFFRPTGIAAYKGKHLLVGDGYLGIIYSFNDEGENAGVLTSGSEKVQLESVTHLRVNGDILGVVDAFTKSIHVYRLEEK